MAMPIFDALRPEGPRDEGFVHAGAVGAGHYAKMVHNGIEYGLMQAYAEGYELLPAKDIVEDVHGASRRGPAAPSCGPGCSTCWSTALEEDPSLEDDLRLRRRLRRGSVDRRGGASTSRCRCRSSRRRCSRGSPRARTNSPSDEGGRRAA